MRNYGKAMPDKEYPYCYGKLEIVFPKEADGLRRSPESCFPCSYKTACLKSAVGSSDGIEVTREMLDRTYASGNISFFERWSRKKDLYRNEKKLKKNHTKK
jgi:hypothetical protein